MHITFVATSTATLTGPANTAAWDAIAERLDELTGGGVADGTATFETHGPRHLDVIVEIDDVLPMADELRRASHVVAGLRPLVTVTGVHADADLVGAAEIARRLGRSRQSIDQLARGQRGAGTFPPAEIAESRSRVWRWVEVAEWATVHLDTATVDVVKLAAVEALDARLRARSVERHLDDASRAAIAAASEELTAV